MFIFARCLRSSAAVTPAKYELDIIQVTAVLIIQKKWENWLSNPHPCTKPPICDVVRSNKTFCDLNIYFTSVCAVCAVLESTITYSLHTYIPAVNANANDVLPFGTSYFRNQWQLFACSVGKGVSLNFRQCICSRSWKYASKCQFNCHGGRFQTWRMMHQNDTA